MLKWILTLFLLISCSDKARYGATEMWFMAKKFDPSVEQVPIPQHEVHRRILCSQYGHGCIPGSGKRILVRKVELIVLEFEDEQSARNEALRLNQYYVRNWLFDDVTGEPVLESFVKEVYNAKNPRLEDPSK